MPKVDLSTCERWLIARGWANDENYPRTGWWHSEHASRKLSIERAVEQEMIVELALKAARG